MDTNSTGFFTEDLVEHPVVDTAGCALGTGTSEFVLQGRVWLYPSFEERAVVVACC